VVEGLTGRIDPALEPSVKLLVSELVTNGVKYGADGALRLQIQAPRPRQVRVEVVDQGGGFAPRPRARPATEPGGWGFHIVRSLADRWGIEDGASRVWFEIDREAA
jgi:anti-sigma regulatory factor (Ser/Thr protein kinase)